MNWNSNEKGPNPWASKSNDPLDDLKKTVNDLLRGFRKKSGGDGDSKNDQGNDFPMPIKRLVISIGLVLLLIWLGTGLYKVENAERGVVTRFGEFSEETSAGLNWHIPYPIESVTLVNVGIVRSIEIGFRANRGKILSESLMLTQDENIIDVQLAVQYQVDNARDYLFNDRFPEITLQQIVESVLREVVGRSKMDFVLTDGRAQVADKVKVLTQESLDDFHIGLSVNNVNMQDAQAPEQVQAAFDDAVKAREDKERFINEAQAYSNNIIPKARGQAARILEEAQGYKERVKAEAEGRTERFENIYAEYVKAPNITRERLYIDSMEKILQETSKVIVDVEGGNNLLYLPIDKLIDRTGNSNNTLSQPSSHLDSQSNTNNSRQRFTTRGERTN